MIKVGQVISYKVSNKNNGILDSIKIGIIDEINEFNCFHICGEQSNLYYTEDFIVDSNLQITIFDFIKKEKENER